MPSPCCWQGSCVAQLAMSELGTDAMTPERTTGLVMRTE
ncbi:hypothetical protein XHC_0342 [Xanthomonas hortorum pv. carotae str. M081]|nr:hypothetical protein XHC_0342 [Xanthomonas hortorum pv. carotae str. M081]